MVIIELLSSTLQCLDAQLIFCPLSPWYFSQVLQVRPADPIFSICWIHFLQSLELSVGGLLRFRRKTGFCELLPEFFHFIDLILFLVIAATRTSHSRWHHPREGSFGERIPLSLVQVVEV